MKTCYYFAELVWIRNALAQKQKCTAGFSIYKHYYVAALLVAIQYMTVPNSL